MNPPQAQPVKWWHICLAVIGLIGLMFFIGRQSFKPNQVYSEKVSAGTTPVIEDETHHGSAPDAH